MTIQKRLIGYSFMVLSLVSCATGSKIEVLEYSIERMHQLVLANLPAPVVSRSINGREYSTGAYRVPLAYRSKIQRNPKGPPMERAYATLTILGDTRPYTINIKIEIEELISEPNEKPKYAISGRSIGMEKDLADLIQKDLVKRNGKSNAFDEMQPF